MRIAKPLWHEGLILTQQHFQQQDRWAEFALRQYACAAMAQPWGTLGVEIDEEALSTGRLKLARLRLCFPDGTPIDTTVAAVTPMMMRRAPQIMQPRNAIVRISASRADAESMAISVVILHFTYACVEQWPELTLTRRAHVNHAR